MVVESSRSFRRGRGRNTPTERTYPRAFRWRHSTLRRMHSNSYVDSNLRNDGYEDPWVIRARDTYDTFWAGLGVPRENRPEIFSLRDLLRRYQSIFLEFGFPSAWGIGALLRMLLGDGSESPDLLFLRSPVNAARRSIGRRSSNFRLFANLSDLNPTARARGASSISRRPLYSTIITVPPTAAMQEFQLSARLQLWSRWFRRTMGLDIMNILNPQPFDLNNESETDSDATLDWTGMVVD